MDLIFCLVAFTFSLVFWSRKRAKVGENDSRTRTDKYRTLHPKWEKKVKFLNTVLITKLYFALKMWQWGIHKLIYACTSKQVLMRFKHISHFTAMISIFWAVNFCKESFTPIQKLKDLNLIYWSNISTFETYMTRTTNKVQIIKVFKIDKDYVTVWLYVFTCFAAIKR